VQARGRGLAGSACVRREEHLRYVKAAVDRQKRTLGELQSLMAAEGYAFARDISVEDVLPWHIVEFLRA
jgi:hypothetical protein